MHFQKVTNYITTTPFTYARDPAYLELNGVPNELAVLLDHLLDPPLF